MILSVLAQVIIDGCKREYEVDALSEIERIKKMPCMNPTLHDEKKDYPFFIKYVKNISVSQKGKDVPYEEIRDKKAKINDKPKNIKNYKDNMTINGISIKLGFEF